GVDDHFHDAKVVEFRVCFRLDLLRFQTDASVGLLIRGYPAVDDSAGKRHIDILHTVYYDVNRLGCMQAALIRVQGPQAGSSLSYARSEEVNDPARAKFR